MFNTNLAPGSFSQKNFRALFSGTSEKKLIFFPDFPMGGFLILVAKILLKSIESYKSYVFYPEIVSVE